ncbi:glutamate racemase [Herpetosiphon geysericola]|uniref:Glutamate racemase n=1 Tax=Herpetosiphon geysericola TaxID=70996 RepID=A0A0P6XTU4_9CHLR|nr:glutamate racemase [Herpetosiphon geysericola]KPL86789.1 glutamate racemase [Herpetosiphon geysericola]
MKQRPIGMFDSGVGGLSTLRDVRALLPNEDIIYYADTGNCPYGGRSHAEIVALAERVTHVLLEREVKIIVVACNTATLHAVDYLREHFSIRFVGMEPGIKPAIAQTKTGVVGVMATQATVAGERFQRLIARYAGDVQVVPQACPGLVELIEAGELQSATTRDAVARYVEPLLKAGADTIVLGCTHYPFLRPLIAEVAGPNIALLDTGAAVARQTQRLLATDELLNSQSAVGSIEWLTSGDPADFAKLRQCLEIE